MNKASGWKRAVLAIARVGQMLLIAGGVAGVGALLLTLGLRWWTDRHYGPLIYDVEGAPTKPVAIVFGAGVWPDGRLSDILADRVSTAADLYRAGKVSKLLMTGDNRFINYNEPQHMREYAVSLGVPDEDIVLDYAGRRTYDSVYRAKHIFMVDSALLVTQEYHLDRALFTADRVGLDVAGVMADRHEYVFIKRYWQRELPATLVAWWQVTVTKPLPVMGDQLPIFADEG